jgi:hypothetical protein
MLAALRYRRIPYRLLVGTHRTPTDLPKPKPQLLPTFYFTKDDGSVEAVVDSTPLLRRFERDYPERKLVPSDPAIAFLDYLLEDFADGSPRRCFTIAGIFHAMRTRPPKSCHAGR